MKVMLHRDLFLGGNRYRQSDSGTEIPDYIDEKKVVLFKEGVDPEKEITLPRDAKMYEAGMKAPPAATRIIREPQATKPVALSELTRSSDAQSEAHQRSIKPK